MNHDWPQEEKTTCLLCGASFLASTAAQTGGVCRRHGNGSRPTLGLPLVEDNLFVAFSPEGKPIMSEDDLPAIPFPHKMIVGPGWLNLDDWIVRTWPCSKSTLGWISEQVRGWCKENPDPVVKEQVNEMISALERQVRQDGESEKWIPGSRWKG